MFHIFRSVKITVEFGVKIYTDREHECDSSKGSAFCALASDFMNGPFICLEQQQQALKIMHSLRYHKDASSSKNNPHHTTWMYWPTSWMSNSLTTGLGKDVSPHGLLVHQIYPSLFIFLGVQEEHYVPNESEGWGWPALLNSLLVNPLQQVAAKQLQKGTVSP